MANEQHVRILKQGVEAWNAWRRDNPAGMELRVVDLSGAELSGAELSGAELSGAELSGANLSEADLSEANLRGATLFWANLSGANLLGADLNEARVGGADLSGAHLSEAYLSWAHLVEANLRGADLSAAQLTGANLRAANLSRANLIKAYLIEANLRGADLSAADLSGANLLGANLSGAYLRGANLEGANLEGAFLVRTLLQQANLSNCRVYGFSAWDVALDARTQQHDLVITPRDQPSITVDNLEVAQFIYLLLRNESLRHVIDTITSKVVLILGRFTPERKSVLDALREDLRKRDRLPVIFDFNVPGTRDTHETITTLARMARFIIADITDPKSIPQELVSIVEQLPSVAVQPILQEGSEPWGMYDHIKRYPWVLPVRTYKEREVLLARLDELVIAPAEAKVKEIRGEGTQDAAGRAP